MIRQNQKCQFIAYKLTLLVDLYSINPLLDRRQLYPELGHKAQQINVFMNVKTAEKSLQFGPSKCK